MRSTTFLPGTPLDRKSAKGLAISLGGDADTQAAIAGGVAEALWGGLPGRIEAEVWAVLDPALLEVVDCFESGFVRTGSATADDGDRPGLETRR